MLSVVHSVDNLLGKKTEGISVNVVIIKRVGTKQNLDYGLEHRLDYGLCYELDMDSIIDSSMDLTVKDYECWRGLCQGLHVHSYAFLISAFKAYHHNALGRYKIEPAVDSVCVCFRSTIYSTGNPHLQ